MKAYWGVEVPLHAFLTSVLDGGEWSASRPGCFTPQGKSPWYALDRRLGGSQNRSGRGGEEKNSQSPPGIEPWNPCPAPSPVTVPTELTALICVAQF
jgi:hypothetical protein